MIRRCTGGSILLLRAARASYHTIQAIPRELTGCRVAAKERALGRIPSVVFARSETDSRKLLLTTDAKQVMSLLEKIDPSFFCTTPLSLQVRAGPGSSVVLQSGTVLPLKVHKNEETGEVLNLVMAWAEEGTKMSVNVPVVFKGVEDCPGLKKGGYLQKLRTSLRYLCPTEHIPQKIEVDLTNLDIGDRVLMSNIEVHSSLKLLSKNDAMPVCKILATKREPKAKSPEATETSGVPEATETPPEA